MYTSHYLLAAVAAVGGASALVPAAPSAAAGGVLPLRAFNNVGGANWVMPPYVPNNGAGAGSAPAYSAPAPAAPQPVAENIDDVMARLRAMESGTAAPAPMASVSAPAPSYSAPAAPAEDISAVMARLAAMESGGSTSGDAWSSARAAVAGVEQQAAVSAPSYAPVAPAQDDAWAAARAAVDNVNRERAQYSMEQQYSAPAAAPAYNPTYGGAASHSHESQGGEFRNWRGPGQW
uniref:Uncharacterized protein n=1 Tax=Hemiselmis tepida TaxID=464990 RepID=A0A7S0Z201_9CRYP|mmetsp:Transcript_38181/g.97601  ORF Transcript_38181/g.97601 Transcript_38181/m.97601 type:complete len:234 (+) Transcript_38181:58-759(+)